jgi:hypothetical protein
VVSPCQDELRQFSATSGATTETDLEATTGNEVTCSNGWKKADIGRGMRARAKSRPPNEFVICGGAPAGFGNQCVAAACRCWFGCHSVPCC